MADSVSDRISKLIYIDAIVLEDKESLISIFGNDLSRFEILNGYVIPPWVPNGKAPPNDVAHPLKTWTDSISLKNPDRHKIPTTYILTVEKGLDPTQDDFASQAAGATKKKLAMYPFIARHLKLNLKNIQDKNGKITESKVVIEDYDKFKIFNGNYPLPTHIVKSNDDVSL